MTVIFIAVVQWQEKREEEEEKKEAYGRLAKLTDEFTGKSSNPFLNLTPTRTVFNRQSGLKYFNLIFCISNSGVYPIRDVKGEVHDPYIEEFTLPKVYGKGRDSSTGINKFEETFELGTITGTHNHHIYTASFFPEISNINTANYVVEVQWHRGRLRYDIRLNTQYDNVSLESVEVTLNGVCEEDFNKFFIFNNLT